MGLEFLLRTLDPIGGWARVLGIRAISSLIEDDPIGFTYKAGHIHAPDYSVTMLSDHSRLAQDSNWQADCKIAFIGDSFTFGLGVNDSEVFPNQVAILMGISVRNYGINGYNTAQVLTMRERIKADGYVYLHIENDWHLPGTFKAESVQRQLQQPVFALSMYLQPRTIRDSNLTPDNADYVQSLDALANDDKVLIFAFNEEIGTQAHERHESIVLLDDGLYKDNQTSYMDAHPNRVGHRLIAETMQPYIEDFVNRVCEDK